MTAVVQYVLEYFDGIVPVVQVLTLFAADGMSWTYIRFEGRVAIVAPLALCSVTDRAAERRRLRGVVASRDRPGPGAQP